MSISHIAVTKIPVYGKGKINLALENKPPRRWLIYFPSDYLHRNSTSNKHEPLA